MVQFMSIACLCSAGSQQAMRYDDIAELWETEPWRLAKLGLSQHNFCLPQLHSHPEWDAGLLWTAASCSHRASYWGNEFSFPTIVPITHLAYRASFSPAPEPSGAPVYCQPWHSYADTVRTLVSGALLFCVLACARWSDVSRLESLQTDSYESMLLVEGDSSKHKTSRSKEAQTRLLPYTAWGTFTQEKPWRMLREGVESSCGRKVNTYDPFVERQVCNLVNGKDVSHRSFLCSSRSSLRRSLVRRRRTCSVLTAANLRCSLGAEWQMSWAGRNALY